MVKKQRGTSVTVIDRLRPAGPVGKRISKRSGLPYYETRRNRSDVSRRRRL